MARYFPVWVFYQRCIWVLCLQSNAKFSLSVEPGNERLRKRAQEITNLRKNGQPTVRSKKQKWNKERNATVVVLLFFKELYNVLLKVPTFLLLIKVEMDYVLASLIVSELSQFSGKNMLDFSPRTNLETTIFFLDAMIAPSESFFLFFFRFQRR